MYMCKPLMALALLLAILLVVITDVVDSAGSVDCSKYNASCGDCTEQTPCYWCSSAKTCLHYPGWTKIIPRNCPKKEWFYGQCFIAGNVLIILVPSVVGTFLIFLGCCIYCCCCRRCSKWKRKRHDKEDLKMKRKREEMQALHAQKKGERGVKRDEIRKKYGLRPSSAGYQKIEEP